MISKNNMSIFLLQLVRQASRGRENPWLSPIPSPAIPRSRLTMSPYTPPPKTEKRASPLPPLLNRPKAALKKPAHQKRAASPPKTSTRQTQISAPVAPTHPTGSRCVRMRTVTGAQGGKAWRRWRSRRWLKQKQSLLGTSRTTPEWESQSWRRWVGRCPIPLILQTATPHPLLSRRRWGSHHQRRSRPNLHRFLLLASPSAALTDPPSLLLTSRRTHKKQHPTRRLQNLKMTPVPTVHLASYTRYPTTL